MNEVNNPHDKFFKKVFSSKSNAEEFLLNYLPSNVIKHLDLKSLEYAKENFVDKHLAEYFSDLLCRINLKDAVERALSDRGGKIMPTIADSLIEEGKKQGLQEGVQQGKQQGSIQKARAVKL